MKNVIYAYKKKSSNKIVYVGQTNNLDYRHKQHIKYDPYNTNNREYNYPLSRGIRKYGEDEYELIILEDDLLQDQLNEREIYWIKFYDTYFNGYNQSTGGSNPVKPIFDDKLIDLVIELLKDYENSYQDICDKTGLSMTHVYNINTGNRRKRDSIQYPIRPNNVAGTKGLKFSPEQNIEIHNLLLYTHKDFKEIAELYHCDAATISRINRGATKSYRLKNYIYPLR